MQLTGVSIGVGVGLSIAFYTEEEVVAGQSRTIAEYRVPSTTAPKRFRGNFERSLFKRVRVRDREV